MKRKFLTTFYQVANCQNLDCIHEIANTGWEINEAVLIGQGCKYDNVPKSNPTKTIMKLKVKNRTKFSLVQVRIQSLRPGPIGQKRTLNLL